MLGKTGNTLHGCGVATDATTAERVAERVSICKKVRLGWSLVKWGKKWAQP